MRGVRECGSAGGRECRSVTASQCPVGSRWPSVPWVSHCGWWAWAALCQAPPSAASPEIQIPRGEVRLAVTHRYAVRLSALACGEGSHHAAASRVTAAPPRLTQMVPRRKHGSGQRHSGILWHSGIRAEALADCPRRHPASDPPPADCARGIPHPHGIWRRRAPPAGCRCTIHCARVGTHPPRRPCSWNERPCSWNERPCSWNDRPWSGQRAADAAAG